MKKETKVLFLLVFFSFLFLTGCVTYDEALSFCNSLGWTNVESGTIFGEPIKCYNMTSKYYSDAELLNWEAKTNDN